MAFNSFNFAVFLLGVLVVYQVFGKVSRQAGLVTLAAASLLFYASQPWHAIIVLFGSLSLNYCAALLIEANQDRPVLQGRILWLAVAANVGALAWFKYVSYYFLKESNTQVMIMPLGISFFTIMQIGALIDLRQGGAKLSGPLEYVLFGAWFPHIMSGPILRFQDFTRQLSGLGGLRAMDVAAGLTYFSVGLFKKALADRVGATPNLLYEHAGHAMPELVWAGLLGYALQLYFDFSGYSDMAIGIARMFSIRYPVNFDAPYQATSIIDFWQRWHMSLTRFIMGYIYNPISMAFARREIVRTKSSYKKIITTGRGFFKLVALPMLITMTLAGVWHGYGLQFLVFGVLHGIFLTINNAWRILLKPRLKLAPLPPILAGFARAGSAILVLLCVIAGQIFFRASSIHNAILVLQGAIGIHDSTAMAPDPSWRGWAFTFLLLASTWIMPSSQRILDGTVPVKLPFFGIELPLWRPSLGWAVCACLLLIGGVYAFSAPSGFLYVQF